MRLFVSITGDYPNIGDAFIRRQAVNWVRSAGSALVYAKSAPDVWVEQVGVTKGDTVINSGRSAWLRAICLRRKAVVAFEPGEIKLDLSALPRELAFLVMALVVRARGGVVLLPPRAVAGHHWATIWVHRILCRVSTVALWRDMASVEVVRAGALVPDIGFSGDVRSGRPAVERTKLLISLRGRRPLPPTAWFDGIREFARDNHLEIVTLSQVHEDEQRSAEIAGRLDAQHFAWVGDDIAHERRLRDLYDQSMMVVSDRLHVLIVASLSGVIPVEIVEHPVPKVRTHFERVGYLDLSMDCRNTDASIIQRFLADQAKRRDELLSAISEGAASLSKFQSLIQAKISQG